MHLAVISQTRALHQGRESQKAILREGLGQIER
jgi:hypothetical protein